MNGDELTRIIKIETLFKERWDNHDKRADERWTETRNRLENIQTRLEGIPCDKVEEKVMGIEKNIAQLWTIVLMVVASCVGGFWWLLRK